jgi:hypothetical protein
MKYLIIQIIFVLLILPFSFLFTAVCFSLMRDGHDLLALLFMLVGFVFAMCYIYLAHNRTNEKRHNPSLFITQTNDK